MAQEKKLTAANRKAGKGDSKVVTPAWQHPTASVAQVKSKVEDIIGKDVLPDSTMAQIATAIAEHVQFVEECGRDEKGRISLLPFSTGNFKEHSEK